MYVEALNVQVLVYDKLPVLSMGFKNKVQGLSDGIYDLQLNYTKMKWVDTTVGMIRNAVYSLKTSQP